MFYPFPHSSFILLMIEHRNLTLWLTCHIVMIQLTCPKCMQCVDKWLTDRFQSLCRHTGRLLFLVYCRRNTVPNKVSDCSPYWSLLIQNIWHWLYIKSVAAVLLKQKLRFHNYFHTLSFFLLILVSDILITFIKTLHIILHHIKCHWWDKIHISSHGQGY